MGPGRIRARSREFHGQMRGRWKLRKRQAAGAIMACSCVQIKILGLQQMTMCQKSARAPDETRNEAQLQLHTGKTADLLCCGGPRNGAVTFNGVLMRLRWPAVVGGEHLW